jgi:CRISPR system Cascade subunit CasE
MYLSQLMPNPRHRDVRRDLARLYELHRTLLRAFPDAAAGGAGRVLFRLDWPRDGSGPLILAQSDHKPDWEKLPQGYCTEAVCKSLDNLTFSPNQVLAFRLRANPTRRVGKSGDERWAGRRVGLMHEKDQLDWLQRKAEQGGFRILSVRAARDDDARASKTDHQMKFLAVRFDGVVEVTDAALFQNTLANGIGSGKAFGFGLVSVGPAR